MLTHQNLSQQEINRKLFHLVALLLPIGIFYAPKFYIFQEWMSCFLLACLSIFMAGIEFFRFRFQSIQDIFHKIFKKLLRENENEKVTGATWYVIAAFICSLLFYGDTHISFMALFMFIVGDAAAAVIGLSMGKIKIGDKTVEGSLGCFILCILTGIIIFPKMPLLLEVWHGYIPFRLIVSVSLIMTILELIPIKLTKNLILNDNVVVPVIGGISLKFLYPFL